MKLAYRLTRPSTVTANVVGPGRHRPHARLRQPPARHVLASRGRRSTRRARGTGPCNATDDRKQRLDRRPDVLVRPHAHWPLGPALLERRREGRRSRSRVPPRPSCRSLPRTAPWSPLSLPRASRRGAQSLDWDGLTSTGAKAPRGSVRRHGHRDELGRNGVVLAALRARRLVPCAGDLADRRPRPARRVPPDDRRRRAAGRQRGDDALRRRARLRRARRARSPSSATSSRPASPPISPSSSRVSHGNTRRRGRRLVDRRPRRPPAPRALRTLYPRDPGEDRAGRAMVRALRGRRGASRLRHACRSLVRRHPGRHPRGAVPAVHRPGGSRDRPSSAPCSPGSAGRLGSSYSTVHHDFRYVELVVVVAVVVFAAILLVTPPPLDYHESKCRFPTLTSRRSTRRSSPS